MRRSPWPWALGALGISAVALVAVVLLTWNSGSTSSSATSTTSPTSTEAEVSTTTTAPVLRYPSGEPVFAGYPLIVPVASIDRRVASAYEGELSDGRVVALAPGVYTPFNPAVPDLAEYLRGPSDGDCAVWHHYFPETGGECWNGVQRGTAEPKG